MPSFFYALGDGALDAQRAGANGDAVSSDATVDDDAHDGVYVACASNGAVCASCDGDAHDGAYGDAHAFDACDVGAFCDALPYITAYLHLRNNRGRAAPDSKYLASVSR